MFEQNTVQVQAAANDSLLVGAEEPSPRELLREAMEARKELPPMPFGGACKHFFGAKPGQGLKEFMQELKALTPEDRAEITEGLVKNGYTITA